MSRSVITAEDKRRFVSFISKSNDCWLWHGSTDGRYGSFSMNGKLLKAHRLSYELFVGEIPKGLFVLHHCDTPACVRPKHLFIGSQSDNLADAAKKGRNAMQRHPERSFFHKMPMHQRLRGDNHPNSKLSINAVIQIKMSRLSTAMLAKQYDVHRTTIQRIRNGQRRRIKETQQEQQP